MKEAFQEQNREKYDSECQVFLVSQWTIDNFVDLTAEIT